MSDGHLPNVTPPGKKRNPYFDDAMVDWVIRSADIATSQGYLRKKILYELKGRFGLSFGFFHVLRLPF